MMMHRPVNDRGNKRAAILIGVPIDFEDFVSRVSKSDWLAKYDQSDLDEKSRVSALRTNWEEEYKGDVADPIREMREFAQSLGVDVISRATLSDLYGCSEDYDVVIIFAHWKGAEVESEDILQPDHVSKYIDCLRNDSSEIGRWLLSRLEQFAGTSGYSQKGLFKRLLDMSRGVPDLTSVQEVLSSAIFMPKQADEAIASETTSLIIEAEVTRRARRREILNTLFGELLRPGNRLELYDGLHRREVVSSSLSQRFSGTLDLTTCTSTILGDYLGGTTKQRVRVVQFPTVQQFAWCAECIRIALHLFFQAGLSYQDARLTASNILATAVLETASND